MYLNYINIISLVKGFRSGALTLCILYALYTEQFQNKKF